MRGCLGGFLFLIGLLVVLGAIGSQMAPNRTATGPTTQTASVTTQVPAADYLARLKEAAMGIPNFDAREFTESTDTIAIAVGLLNAYATVADEGTGRTLSADEKAARRELLTALGRKQASALPILRDAFGPAMREELWVDDGSAKTFGTGFRTIQFISADFAANRNIQSTHAAIREMLTRLRFTRAQYKWLDADVEYQYYTLEPPSDGAVVMWNGASFRKVE